MLLMEKTKHCPRCETDKPVSAFYSNRSSSDGLSGYCRSCQNIVATATRSRLAEELVALLGGKCARCDEDDVRVLQVDHVRGGGTADRRTTGLYRHHRGFVERVRENPADYQLLCVNCNVVKRVEENEHKGDRSYPRSGAKKVIRPRAGRQAQAKTTATTKHCTKCDTTKPIEDFIPNRARLDGLSSWCRACQREYDEGWRKRLRAELLSILGESCVKCGWSDARALQVDHINGGGSIERQTGVWVVGKACLERVKVNPEQYQLLCANCNAIKRVEQAECGNRQYSRTEPDIKPWVGKGYATGRRMVVGPDGKRHWQKG